MDSLDDLGFDPSRFYVGVLCKREHRWKEGEQSLRYLSGCCVECKRVYHHQNQEKILTQHAKRYREVRDKKIEWQKNYYQKNRESILGRHREALRARSKIYYWKNREARLVYRRFYVLKNQDKEKAWRDAYHKTPRARALAVERTNRRRLRKAKNHSVSVSQADINSWLSRFDCACAWCGCTDKPCTIDHFIPISKGGSHCLGNIVPACSSCNSSKNDSEPFEWYRRQSFFSQSRWKLILKILDKNDSNWNQIPLF